MLLLLANRRFGSEELPTDFGSRLEHYTAAQLTDLVGSIATSPDLEEWLGSFPPL
ncbi:MAG: hypothetical protein HXX20_23060, partial [Chloroflexi bacterium]|nr:hypothetical protein [Chloroflexota bacterium]